MTGPPAGSTATYSYDALNHRVETTLGNSGTPTVLLYNLAGKRVSEWQYNGLSGLGFLKGHYYFGSRPVAYYTVANMTTMPTLTFEHQDWLGTERMRTTSTGVVLADYTSLPFGDNQKTVPVETYTPGLQYDTDAAHYAMLDHDSETNTDHAEFRQYDNQQGRWMSPDPYRGSYNFYNPQSFDRYAYVMDNPAVGADPSGLYWCVPFEYGSSNFCHAPNFGQLQDTTAYYVMLSDWQFYSDQAIFKFGSYGGDTYSIPNPNYDPSLGPVIDPNSGVDNNSPYLFFIDTVLTNGLSSTDALMILTMMQTPQNVATNTVNPPPIVKVFGKTWCSNLQTSGTTVLLGGTGVFLLGAALDGTVVGAVIGAPLNVVGGVGVAIGGGVAGVGFLAEHAGLCGSDNWY
jgi:RHS repeat-associated protein